MNPNRSNTILACFNLDNGTFNLDAYLNQRKRKRQAAVDEIVELCLNVANEEENSIRLSRKREVRNAIRGQMPQKLDSNGNYVPLDPQDTIWWKYYIEAPPLSNKRFHNKFRRRFCMPYENFCELLNEVKEHPLFKGWSKADCTGRQSSPVELMLLGTLRLFR